MKFSHDGDTGDDLISAMAENGVEALFYCNGSELMFYQEAMAKRMAQGQHDLKLYTMVHEIVCLNAALGYAAVTGKPAVTTAHVDLGTLNHGAAIHAAARARLPVLMTAGMPPTATPGTMRGARDKAHFWAQQTPDQNSIVRQYMKWTHTLQFQDNPGTVISRALQMARAVPEGPVYLSMPREIPMLPRRETEFTTLADLGLPEYGTVSDELGAQLVQALLQAKSPAVLLGLGGRDPRASAALAEFADLFGVTVFDGGVFVYQGLSFQHPLYQREGDLSPCDLIITLECPIPWGPGPESPSPQAKVIVVDPAPAVPEFTLMEFPATHRIVSESAGFLAKLTQIGHQKIGETDRHRIAERKGTISTAVKRRRAALREQAERRQRTDVIDAVWASSVVARKMPDDARVFDDTIFSAPVHKYLTLEGPGQLFKRPSSSGGWATGAALGAKIADPSRPCISINGDGFYMFGVPNCALWAARTYNAPFLSIIFQNDSYNTGTEVTARHYPGGYATQSGYPGGYLTPGIDFAAESRAVGAYGENVERPQELEAALDRGLKAIETGQSAVISIKVPRLMEDA